MQLNEGWLVGARRVPRRTMTAVRMKKPLPYWWCITLACHRVNLVVRGLMRCSLAPWIPMRILSFPRLLICAFRHIV